MADQKNTSNKTIYIIVIVVALILLALYYFTQTQGGLTTRIMMKYPVPEDRKLAFKQELAGRSVEELKDILKYGGQ